jgi:hypothetical protein
MRDVLYSAGDAAQRWTGAAWTPGAPEEIRTPDPQIRSLVLYPAELRALSGPQNLFRRGCDIKRGMGDALRLAPARGLVAKSLFQPGKFPQHAASHALVAVAPPV